MSLKQFPAPSVEKRLGKDALPPRMVAAMFDPSIAWEVVDRRKEKLKDVVDVSGFGKVGRRKAEEIARASGIAITKGFSVAKAVDSYRISKFREMQAYLLFLLIFTVNTYYYGDFEHANQIKSSLQTALFETQYLASESGDFITFGEANSESDFWDFLTYCFATNLFPSNFSSMDCDGPCSASQGMQNLMKYNRLVQPIRIRQLRVNAVNVQDCDIAIDMIVSGADFRCWPAYSPNNENKSSIHGWPKGSIISYSSASSISTEAYGRRATTTFSGGGFVLDIPLGSTPDHVSELIQYLKESRWTDLGTRAVFIDLCVYNPSFEFFTSIRLLFEFLPFGDVRPSSSVLVFKGAAIPNVLHDTVFFYMDLVLYFILILFWIWDMHRISKVGSLFFKSFWNWINLVNYAMYTVTFVQKRLYLNLEAVQAYSVGLPSINSTNQVYDFNVVGQRYTVISVLLGYTSLLCWIRILSYMRYFNRDMSLLVASVGNCAADTFVWFFVIAIVVFIYAQAFFLAFGPNVDGFNTLAQSLGTMCEWMFHRVDVADIVGVDQGVASLLFISFQAIYSLLLFNLLWIVIMRSYKDVRTDGVDDPIAVEIRKLVLSTFRIWRSTCARIFLGCVSWSEEDDNDSLLIAGATSLPANARLSDMTKEEYQESVARLLVAMDSLASEAHYMIERVDDIAREQSDAMRWHAQVSEEESNASVEANEGNWKDENNAAGSNSERGLEQELADLLHRYEALSTSWIAGVRPRPFSNLRY